jgi:N-acetylmuramoyl-L-alanine amidase
MGLFDIFKKKEKEPVVVHKTTTVVKKNTTVVKKNTPKEETKKDNSAPTAMENEPRFTNLIVCLDPGHAVSTPGKRSPYSACKVEPALDFYEYKFNREICDILHDMLIKEGIDVFITTDENRDGDIDVSLTTRATRAWNAIKASGKKGIFVSVHANANGKGSAWDKAKGWSTYTTKGNNISDQLADYFYDEAEKLFDGKKLKIRTNKSDNDRDWEENFTVIFKMEQFSTKNGKPTVPAVLTENFFYSNADDCKYLCSKKGKEDIVKLHF